MLWPRPSTVSTKPRSSIGAGRGGRSTPSSSRRWNGWTGSTIDGCWSPSAISRQPKPRRDTMPSWSNQPWRRDSNETASGKPGAVHRAAAVEAFHRLYRFARGANYPPLAVFSAYKAVQKLDEEAIADEGLAIDGADYPGATALPLWVRDGLWFTLEKYVLNLKQKPSSDKQTPISFSFTLEKHWTTY